MPPMVSALGVNIRRLFMIVFGFGTMLAGFAGIMIAPILSVEPGMGDTILILAFVVIVIGGIGSIRGAFLAALLIGLVDTLGRSFAVDILRLFMAPSPARTVGPAHRLDADLSADGGGAVCPAGRPVPREGPLRWRTALSLAAPAPHGALAMRAANALPIADLPRASRSCRCSPRSGAEAYVLSLVTRVMIFAIAALALDLLVGYGALVSFGHAAFIGLGAYAVGILASHGINDALISLPVALGVSALFALLTGIVCLRTKGVYFIMITLAFGQMAFFTASSLAPYGGDDGLTIACAQHACRLCRCCSNDRALYYVCLRLPARRLSALPRAGRLALRPRLSRRAGKSAAHGDDRLRRLSLPARRLRDRRRARRACPASCSPMRPSSSARPTCHGSARANCSSW